MKPPVIEAAVAGWAVAALAFAALLPVQRWTRRRSGRLAQVVAGEQLSRPASSRGLRAYLHRLESRHTVLHRRKNLETGFEDVIVEIAEALRSGETLLQALTRAGRSAPRPWVGLIREVLARYERGIPLIQALGVLEPAGGRPARLLVRATDISLRAGGNLPEALFKLAQGVREERLLRSEITARTAEARWTAYCVAATPGLLVAYFLFGAPDMFAPLLTDPLGRLGLLYAIVSWLMGFLVLRHLAAFDTPGDAD